MPIDKLLIKQRLEFINQCLIELKELSKLPKNEFVNKRTAASAENFLRRSLEAIFDIGRHILAKSGGTDIAREYKGIARGLGDMGIITDELKEQLIKMAGYRNRLVLLYYQVSDEELYEIIKANLKDIRQFKNEILEYIKEI